MIQEAQAPISSRNFPGSYIPATHLANCNAGMGYDYMLWDDIWVFHGHGSNGLAEFRNGSGGLNGAIKAYWSIPHSPCADETIDALPIFSVACYTWDAMQAQIMVP